MKYQKSNPVSGLWAKGSELVSGTRAKLVSETTPIPSQFKNKDGSTKNQDVAKLRIEDKPESMNISLNRATLDAMIDAFGDDSKDWINKDLTIQTEKVMVSGKRVTAVYLLPENYVMKEDENGYVKIVNPSKDKDSVSVPEPMDGEVEW